MRELAAPRRWCGPGPAPPRAGGPAARRPPPAPIVWSTCPTGSDPPVRHGLGPARLPPPGAGSLTLAVTRAPALDPGRTDRDPGVQPRWAGREREPDPSRAPRTCFPRRCVRHFDVVSFDPRGTGASDPLRCGTSPSAVASVPPGPASPGRPLPGTPVFTAMARACQNQAPAPRPSSTRPTPPGTWTGSARPSAVPTISFYGLSYGTVLGAVYADLFPHRVATMVLDGAVDLNASLTQQAEQEAPAAEQSLHHLFATCRPAGACPLGADPEATFAGLATSLTRPPAAGPRTGDTSPVTVGDLDTATLFALSVPQVHRRRTSPPLVAADHGNGAPLRSLSLELRHRHRRGAAGRCPVGHHLQRRRRPPRPGHRRHPGPDPRRPLPAHRGLRGDLHDGRLRLLAERPSSR